MHKADFYTASIASPGELKQLGAKSHSIVVPSLGLNLGVICLLMSVSRSWTYLTCCDSSKGPTAPQGRLILGLLLTHHSQVWVAYKLWQYLNYAIHFESSHLYIAYKVQSNVNAPKKQAKNSGHISSICNCNLGWLSIPPCQPRSSQITS